MIFSTRLATPEDQLRLLAVVVSTTPPLQLARTADTPLAHPGVYPCFLVGRGEMLASMTPIALVSHLAPGSLVAWSSVDVMVLSGDPATHDAALAAVNECIRVYGILHVPLPPATLPAEDTTALGSTPDTSGCWRHSARSSSEALG